MRTKGEGTIGFDETTGWFTWRVRLKVNGESKRFVRKAKSRKELNQKINSFWEEVRTNGIVPTPRLQLGNWCYTWLETVKPTIKPRTYDYYIKFIRNYIVPQIGSKVLKELTSQDLQLFFNHLAVTDGCKGNPLSASSINGIRRTLLTILEAAYNNGYVARNVAKTTKRLRVEPKSMIVLNSEQLRNMLDVASKPDYM